MGGTLALTFLALGTMVWAITAADEFDLVTEQGQSLGLFFDVSLFLVPALVTVVMPVAALIAVVHTMTRLNGDSELAVVNATGAPQLATLKPSLLIGSITMAAVASMTLYFTPLSIRLGQSLVTSVRSDLLTAIIREGQFMTLADGLTFHLRNRNPDGSLHGIFIADDRQAGRSLTYLAETGAILDNPLGVFLVMTNGVIQQRDRSGGSLSMIEFSTYAFDLSSLASAAITPGLSPAERSTAYLINPDPDDPTFRRSPAAFRSELHTRITTPFYGLAFCLIPLLFIGQAASPRESRAAGVAVAVAIVAVLGANAIFLPSLADDSAAAIVLMYALPLGAAAVTVALVLAGAQLRPPARFVAFGEALSGRLSGLLRPETATPGGDETWRSGR